MLEQYQDLLANVRRDNKLHSIRQLIQPDEPEVRDVARVLVGAPDFVKACQDFVNSFTTYQREVGDYWTTPAELLQARAGDCDDKAILLTSLLRNYIPAENVFSAFGTWRKNGKDEGHMWVVMENGNGTDRIIEATAPSSYRVKGRYKLMTLFNDRYAFSYPQGLSEFELTPVEQGAEVIHGG